MPSENCSNVDLVWLQSRLSCCCRRCRFSWLVGCCYLSERAQLNVFVTCATFGFVYSRLGAFVSVWLVSSGVSLSQLIINKWNGISLLCVRSTALPLLVHHNHHGTNTMEIHTDSLLPPLLPLTFFPKRRRRSPPPPPTKSRSTGAHGAVCELLRAL